MNHFDTSENRLKLFQISNQLTENSLDHIEERYAIDLGRLYVKTIEADRDYYPQIDRSIRVEASQMARAYEVFYSLEKTIRAFIEDSFEAAGIVDWWADQYVPARIKTDTESRMQKELDSGVTPRSSDPIDFTTFGELSEIIKSNWDVFSGSLRSQRALVTVMSRLNTLRGPIAHCSPLAEDELIRLRLSVRDWFRLME
ncbi:MAG: Swt1 family HEPN domain-containing protein [Raoultibacter sp.]